MHPRVGLHQVAFLDENITAFVEHCRRIGVHHATLVTASLMRPGGVDEAQLALAGGRPTSGNGESSIRHLPRPG